MKREILFRGKSISTGEWIEGNFIHRGQTGLEYIRNNDSLLKVYPATVGQFTGLCDKDGVKIFEGDKLYCEARLDKAEMYVVFEEGQFRMVLCDKFKEYETGRGYYDINCFQKTVIGNIHDNPELVKEESK